MYSKRLNKSNDFNSFLFFKEENQVKIPAINGSHNQTKINMSTVDNGGRNTSSSRGSVCSKRKLPGETSVKDLDPTLKMVIIKELSAEKVDGKVTLTLKIVPNSKLAKIVKKLV